MRAGGAGIKREGLLYLEKYGISGPEFGIKVGSGSQNLCIFRQAILIQENEEKKVTVYLN